MARTYVSETTFKSGDKEIRVERDDTGHYRVRCSRINGWKVIKSNLRGRKAAWFVLKCIKARANKYDLSAKIVQGKVKNLLLEGEMHKMNGVEWISMSIMHGVRPIILKAPALFKQRLIYIEPLPEPGKFSLRIVDPLTEHRSIPVEVSQETVDQAIKTFGNEEIHEESASQR